MLHHLHPTVACADESLTSEALRTGVLRGMPGGNLSGYSTPPTTLELLVNSQNLRPSCVGSRCSSTCTRYDAAHTPCSLFSAIILHSNVYLYPDEQSFTLCCVRQSYVRAKATDKGKKNHERRTPHQWSVQRKRQERDNGNQQYKLYFIE